MQGGEEVDIGEGREREHWEHGLPHWRASGVPHWRASGVAALACTSQEGDPVLELSRQSRTSPIAKVICLAERAGAASRREVLPGTTCGGV